MKKFKKFLYKLDGYVAYLIFLIWLSIFASGLIIPSEPYLNQFVISNCVEDVRSPDCMLNDKAELVFNWVMAFITFIPTNVAMLCVFASMLGASANRNKLVGDAELSPVKDSTNPYASGLIRGFVIFLVLISGLLLLTEDPFGDGKSYSQYIRVAGIASIVSFLVSYNPQSFAKIFQKIDNTIMKKVEHSNKDCCCRCK